MSAALQERYAEMVTARAVAAGLPPGPAREGAEARLELLPEGRSVPFYDRVRVDRESRHVWLREFVLPWHEGGAATWAVHDDGGRLLARVETPAGFGITAVMDGHIAGVTVDPATGVESATVYRVLRRSPDAREGP